MSIAWMVGEMFVQVIVIIGAASAVWFWAAVLMGAV
jgi:hypothetical protein